MRSAPLYSRADVSLQERSGRTCWKRGSGTWRAASRAALVVARASGALVWDVDGREYLDFAGGIGCQNLGHGDPAVVAAIHAQVDAYLHQCFMVGIYEPYVDVAGGWTSSRRAAAATQRSMLVNSGAEAVENAVKIARAATGRPAVVVFDNAFHGRTLLTLAMTAKSSTSAASARSRPRSTARRRRTRTAASRRTTRSPASSGCSRPRSTRARSRASCSSRCRARAGSSRCRPTSRARAARALDEHGILYVDDEVQSGVGRTGPVWAIEHYGVEPDLLVAGKSLGGGLPLAERHGPRRA